MGNTAGNVTYGKPKIGGAVFRAKAGTTLPTDATTALSTEFKALGYISEDGVTNGNAIDSGKITAWGGDTVLNVKKGQDDTFKFKMIESTNPEVLKTVYGDSNVEGELATGIKVKVNAADAGESSWVIDMILKGGIAKRLVIPAASVTALEDIVYKDDQAVGYGITLTATPDENGDTHIEYIVKGQEE